MIEIIEIWTTPTFEYFVIPASIPYTLHLQLNINYYQSNGNGIIYLVNVKELYLVLNWMMDNAILWRMDKTSYPRFGEQAWMIANGLKEFNSVRQDLQA